MNDDRRSSGKTIFVPYMCDHAYALAARCGTTDHPLAADTAEGVTPSARAWQLGDRVLVELTLKLAREGEYGTTLGAAVIDGATCTVASALD